MKGIKWKPHKQRWVVAFRVETRLTHFGQFKTYCEAIKRASEVWPTLPIAKRKIKTCDTCGKQGVVPHEFEFQNTTCKECKSVRRDSKRNELLSRQCRVCGKAIGTTDKRQVVCTFECGHKGRKRERAVFECSVCGNAVTRYADHLDTFNAVACSHECQKVIAGRAGKDHEKAAVKAAEKTRRKWYKERSKSRKAANEWIRTCGEQANKLNSSNAELDEWQVRCNNAVTALSLREYDIATVGTNTTVIETEELDTWEQSISRAFSMRGQKPPKTWSKKCSSIAANLKLRKRRQTPVR